MATEKGSLFMLKAKSGAIPPVHAPSPGCARHNSRSAAKPLSSLRQIRRVARTAVGRGGARALICEPLSHCNRAGSGGRCVDDPFCYSTARIPAALCAADAQGGAGAQGGDANEALLLSDCLVNPVAGVLGTNDSTATDRHGYWDLRQQGWAGHAAQFAWWRAGGMALCRVDARTCASWLRNLLLWAVRGSFDFDPALMRASGSR